MLPYEGVVNVGTHSIASLSIPQHSTHVLPWKVNHVVSIFMHTGQAGHRDASVVSQYSKTYSGSSILMTRVSVIQATVLTGAK